MSATPGGIPVLLATGYIPGGGWGARNTVGAGSRWAIISAVFNAIFPSLGNIAVRTVAALRPDVLAHGAVGNVAFVEATPLADDKEGSKGHNQQDSSHI